jgi:hypothetical protein
MLNLIQIQEKLKDMPTQAVMQYANGMNAQVPPYVALGELNRRKQMQTQAEGMQAQGQQPTVKDQTEQGLGVMALQGAGQPAGQIGQEPQQQMPQEEPVQMAAGGLTSLPMRGDMFKRNDYAGGGIVAFEEGGDTGLTEEEMRQGSEPTKEELESFYSRNAPAAPANSVKPEAQGPVTSKDLMGILMTQAASGKSLEDIAAEIKKAKELSGVKQNPFEESAKRRAEYERVAKEQQAGQGMDQLREWLRGAASSKPGQGLGMILGGGGEAQAKAAKAQQELNQKQAETMINWQKADEKEQDAIARGDAKAILEAKAEKDKLNYNIAKLSADKESLAYQKFMMAVNGDPYLKQLEERRKKSYAQPGSEKDLDFDRQMNARKAALAKEAGYEYRDVPYENPVIPKEKPKEKGIVERAKEMFSSDKKEEKPASRFDTGIPAGLPSGTKAIGRTPTGEVVYLTPDGKKVTAK